MAWVEELSSNNIYFNVIKHGNKISGVAFLVYANNKLKFYFVENVKENRGSLLSIFGSEHKKICFDMRSIVDLNIEYSDTILDMSLFYGDCYDSSYNYFSSVINKKLNEDDIVNYIESANVVKAHISACTISKVDISRHDIFDVIPKASLLSFYSKKLQTLKLLHEKLDIDFDSEYVKRLNKFAHILYQIEKNGIKISDEKFEDLTVAESKWLSHAKKLKDIDGFAHCKFLPNKSVTGRTQVMKNSLRVLNIPKTKIRKSIYSRYQGGKILTIDYNAIDYRIIVKSTGNEQLISTYKECDDFHKQTVYEIFKNDKFLESRRKVIKQLTYVLIYGGHFDYKKCGMREDVYNKLFDKLKFMLEPIEQFKNELYERAIDSGYVSIVGGRRVDVKKDFHPGKVLAYYAQTSTNEVFMHSINKLFDYIGPTRSKMLFTVHDEAVVDLHPEEFVLVRRMKDIMESEASNFFKCKFVANVDIKENYWGKDE